MLTTRITDMFGIDYPIMSAPMANHSGGTLAAAVSAAGGLGSFGAISDIRGPDWVRGQAEYIRSQTDRPFGIGFITVFIPMFEGHFQAALETRPPVLALSFGTPAPYIERGKAAGAKLMCQVQTLESAAEAVSAGADVLVAQGNEAGGHTGTMNLLPLLVRILDKHPDVPVMASGGIATGRSLAAVLAAGADGAWVGTAFLATPEAVEVHETHKRIVVESDGQDTAWTTAYDTLSGAPWPQGIGGRVRRNRFVNEWDARDEEIAANRAAMQAEMDKRRDVFDIEAAPIWMGQGAGAVQSVRPAADVLRDICGDAERILRERLGRVLG